jgi:hypothetical protein
MMQCFLIEFALGAVRFEDIAALDLYSSVSYRLPCTVSYHKPSMKSASECFFSRIVSSFVHTKPPATLQCIMKVKSTLEGSPMYQAITIAEKQNLIQRYHADESAMRACIPSERTVRKVRQTGSNPEISLFVVYISCFFGSCPMAETRVESANALRHNGLTRRTISEPWTRGSMVRI